MDNSMDKYEELYKHSKYVLDEEISRFGRIEDKAARFITVVTSLLAVFALTGRQLFGELIPAENNMEILGIYHSHPDHPSKASETDRRRAWPEWIYIIFSINSGKYNDARAWVLEDFDSNFIEEQIEVTEG